MSAQGGMTGILCADDCLPNYLKLTKHKDYKYVIFRISKDNKHIEFDKGGGKHENFEDFRNTILEMKEEPCYAAYDFHYKTVDGQDREKVAFMLVCSDDDVQIKRRMLYTSTKPELTKKLDPATFVKEIQINDFDDLSEEEIVNTISNNRQK